MKDPQRTVPVLLTCEEASSILVLMQSGSFPPRAAADSATTKIRDALVATGFDSDIEVKCTTDEAAFVERARRE